VGSGPAGVATAAAILKMRPELRDAILILEKEKHPRHKLCGGGVTPWADKILTELDITVDVPAIEIKKAAFYFKNEKPVFVNRPNLMRIVWRNEYDAALVQRLKDHGVRVLEESGLKSVEVKSDGVYLETEKGKFQSDIIVGADGAKSMVRRRLFREEPSNVSRAIEVLVPVDDNATPEFQQNMINIDFRQVTHGLQGYLWDFPCLVEGKPFLNIGAIDSRVINGPRTDMPALVKKRVERRGYDTNKIQIRGNPERWYYPGYRYSRSRSLLVGEAAGIEPLLGEGISFALAYGQVAGKTICDALDKKDFSFSQYEKHIKETALGWYLRRNQFIAKLFYRPWLYPIFPLIAKMFRLNKKYSAE